MNETILLTIALIVGLYMSWNIGANDAANAMGTSVGSRALTMRQAVIIAALLEFSGAYFFGSHVSKTIQKGIVNTSIFLDQPMILAYGMIGSLIASGVWLQIASYKGWPVSTTHSIVGSILGFGIVVGGTGAVQWEKVGFIVSSWVVSPLIGGALSFCIFSFLRKKIFFNRQPVKAAKTIAPYLLSVVITILTLVLLFKGLKNLHLDLTFFEALLISLFIGCIFFVFGRLWVKNIDVEDYCIEEDKRTSPEVIHSLEKAQKHLNYAQQICTQDEHKAILDLLEKVQRTNLSLQKSQAKIGYEYQTVEKIFGLLQIITACFMAFAHGANDVANAIGPLSATINILKTGSVPENAPVLSWVLAIGGIGIVVGLATWGWRVIETVGKKITELTPSRGFAAEFGAATTLVIASRMGLPVSTTHTLVGAVLGVGIAGGISSINLNTVRDIVVSWMVTIPAGASIAIVSFYILKFTFG